MDGGCLARTTGVLTAVDLVTFPGEFELIAHVAHAARHTFAYATQKGRRCAPRTITCPQGVATRKSLAAIVIIAADGLKLVVTGWSRVIVKANGGNNKRIGFQCNFSPLRLQ